MRNALDDIMTSFRPPAPEGMKYVKLKNGVIILMSKENL